MLFLVLIVELAILYFLSRWMTQKLFELFLLLFRIRSLAISLVTIILFPGTVIHELAHLFVAEVLGVHTGKLTLAPESIEGEDIRTGSVAIAHSDPLRRSAIGIAPVLIGLLIIAALSYWLPTLIHNVDRPNGFSFNLNTLSLLLNTYLLFAVSNSMFSSKEDMKGVVPLAIVLGLLVGASHIAGIRIGLTGQALDVVMLILFSLTQSLTIVLAVNLTILLITHGLIVLTGKITKRRMIKG